MELTTEELAARAGTSLEQIDGLVRLGILERDDAGRFPLHAVHAVRLAEALDRAGISLEDLGQAVAAGKLSFGFVAGLLPRRPAVVLDRDFHELARESGIPLELIQQMWVNYNLPSPAPDQLVREDDARIVAGRAELFHATGGNRETLLAASRFFGDNLRRAATAQVRFFRERIIDPLLESGMPPGQVLDVVAPVSARMQRNADELLRLLYERHLESAIHQETVELIERAMEDAGIRHARTERTPAIAFLDLGGYTALTEQRGDEAAAELAGTLAALVRRASSEYGGQAVKLLGDGVMFYFPEPRQAVACAVDLVARTEREALPPARVGIHAGPVVFRDGDYFGRTVNIAARIADRATAGEVLASDAVASACADGTTVGFEDVGRVTLKGVAEPVTLYRAS